MDENSIKALALGMSLDTIDLMLQLNEEGFYENGFRNEDFFEGLKHAKKMINDFINVYEKQWGNLASAQAQKEEGRWMVYDDESEDEIYHETLEQAEKDYNDALNDISEGSKVVMFKVVKEEFKDA